MNRKLLVLSLAAALAGAAPASATIVSISPTGGSTGDNVINNACTGEIDSGPVLVGCMNGDHNASVSFNSNELLVFGGGGQAVVQAQDGLMGTLTINPSFDIGELIVNINASADSWVKFCDNGGCWGTLFAVNGNGSNFFDITFDPAADFLTFSTYTNSNGTGAAQLIEDSRQWRLQQGTTRVPEPASWAFVAPFLLGGLYYLRRRQRVTLA